MISIIVAVSTTGAIGKDNQLLWKLSADLKYFKNLTTGNTVVMGRKTYDSIGKPLPNRKNVVISRNKDLKIDGVEVVDSLEAALQHKQENIFIIGGAEIYKQAMPYADRLYVTHVNCNLEGDAYFPMVDVMGLKLISEELHAADEKNEYDYCFAVYEKK